MIAARLQFLRRYDCCVVVIAVRLQPLFSVWLLFLRGWDCCVAVVSAITLPGHWLRPHLPEHM